MSGLTAVPSHNSVDTASISLDRSLADEQVIAVDVLHDDGQPASLEVERKFVDLAVGRGGEQRLGCSFGEVQDSAVHQILDAALVKAVEPGQGEHIVVAVAPDVRVMLEDDPVLGEGSGLVGAQHVHRAEVLDRVEALHHDLATRQCDGTLGEVG